jgi:hypothetical protein
MKSIGAKSAINSPEINVQEKISERTRWQNQNFGYGGEPKRKDNQTQKDDHGC